MPKKPILQALILADRIYTEEGTGKKIIAGTFNRISAETFPAPFVQNAWIFVSLTDFVGTIAIEVQIRHLRTNTILLQTPPIQIRSKDPLRSFDLILALPEFMMPEPGTYSLDVVYEGDLLGSLRLSFAKRQGEPT